MFSAVMPPSPSIPSLLSVEPGQPALSLCLSPWVPGAADSCCQQKQGIKISPAQWMPFNLPTLNFQTHRALSGAAMWAQVLTGLGEFP